MARLSDAEKHAIVMHLACFARPSQVVAIMKADFGVTIDRFQVRAYDPTGARYEGGDKWRAVFEAARRRYLEDVAGVPIAHLGFRLKELQKLLFKAEASGNLVLSLSILSQAAKEAGRQSVVMAQRHSQICSLPGSAADRREQVRSIISDAICSKVDQNLAA